MLNDNGEAALTNNQLCSLLEELTIDIVKNKNIVSWNLGSKGLYLNWHHNGRKVLNLKARIRKLWLKFGYQSNVTSVSSVSNTFNQSNKNTDNNLPTNLITSSQIKDSEIFCESSNSSNTTEVLYNLGLENPNWIIVGHLNINSIRNKFDM